MGSIIHQFRRKVQTFRHELKEDIQAVFERDPAARNTAEVLLTYPRSARINAASCGACHVAT